MKLNEPQTILQRLASMRAQVKLPWSKPLTMYYSATQKEMFRTQVGFVMVTPQIARAHLVNICLQTEKKKT